MGSSSLIRLMHKKRVKESRGTTAMVFMDILWTVSKGQEEVERRSEESSMHDCILILLYITLKIWYGRL